MLTVSVCAIVLLPSMALLAAKLNHDYGFAGGRAMSYFEVFIPFFIFFGIQVSSGTVLSSFSARCCADSAGDHVGGWPACVVSAARALLDHARSIRLVRDLSPTTRCPDSDPRAC